MIGRTLAGKYQLLEKIREQRFYDVYAARLINTDTRYIIKLLTPKYVAPKSTLAALAPNLGVISSLRHPRIAYLRDYGEDATSGFLYLAEEYYEGTILSDVLRAGSKLNSLQALDLAIKIMEALGHAHGKKISHGLLSPETVVVLGNLNIKLCDFYSLAALASQPFVSSQGHAVRDLRYCAPESISGITATLQSDIYSAGVITYELMTGRLPYTLEQAVDIAMDKNYYEPPQPRDLNPQIPLLLNSVILKSLKPRPASRYESASEFLSELLLCRSSMMRAISAQQQPASWPQQPMSPAQQMPAPTMQSPLAQPPVAPPPYVPPPLPAAPPREQVYSYSPPPREQAPAYVPRKAIEPDPPRRASAPETLKLDTVEADADHLRTKKIMTIVLATTLFALFIGIMGFGWSMLKSNLDWGSGKKEVEVPNVVGMDQTEATSAINSAKLKIKVVEIPSNDIPKGQVIKQDPSAGQKVKEGREITISVSLGEEPVQVPDFRNRLLKDAEILAKEKGFRIRVTEEYDESKAKNYVTAQEPGPGEMKTSGDIIKLFVSKGPEPLQMPNLVGKSVSEAPALLGKIQQGGIIDVPTNSAAANTIIAQSILPGTMVDAKNDAVKLYIAKPVEGASPDDGGLFGSEGTFGGAEVETTKHNKYTITITEPGTSNVSVEVIDKASRKEFPLGDHVQGDKIEFDAEGKGDVYVNVYINGKLKLQKQF